MRTSVRHDHPLAQGLAEAAGSPVTISFTPHLMPFSRGMEADIYVKLASGATVDDLRQKLAERYADEPFISVLPKVQTVTIATWPVALQDRAADEPCISALPKVQNAFNTT